MINLRYRLLPLHLQHFLGCVHNDGTFMRPLVMDFAADSKTHEVGGEFLFGRSLLVAPVTRPEVTEWSVYLPQGADWVGLLEVTKKQQGGQTLNRCVSKRILPVYVKACSILPFVPKYSIPPKRIGTNPWRYASIRVPTAHSPSTRTKMTTTTTKKGAYSTIRFHWNDKARRLTIEEREGSFPGMLKSREFKVVLAGSENSGTGDRPMKGGKTISYAGKKKSIKL